MYRFRKAFLLINTFLIISACASYKGDGIPQKNTKEFIETGVFDQLDKDYLFRAEIKAYGNSFSGILAVKKTEKHHKRVALLSNMGNTLFDFEFQNNRIKVNYVMEDLNKKIIVNKLKRYFQLLVQGEYPIKNTLKMGDSLEYVSHYQKNTIILTFSQDQKLVHLQQLSKIRTKVDIHYYQGDNQLDSIHMDSHTSPIFMHFYPEK